MKFLYPIKKLNIKPWIKYWLLKKGLNPIVLSDLIEGTSPITIENVYEGTTLQEIAFKGQTIQNRVVKEDNYININSNSYRVDLGGTNLFNFNDTASVTNSTVDSEGWITATIDNSSGSGWGYANYFMNLIPQLKENTTYSVLVELKEINGNLRNIVFNATNSQINTSVNIVLANYQEGSKVVNTVTTRENFSGIQYGLRLYVDTRANTSGSVTYRVSLIEGTNISTEYSPYTANPIELGENDKIWNDEGIWRLNNSEITNTNLIEQLEAIKNATLISGTNEITQLPSDLPFILNFKYYMKG